ncbi:MAG: class I SAM-dependent methyltransferase [Pseudolabrys sp.]
MKRHLKLFVKGFLNSLTKNHRSDTGDAQALDIYSDEAFANLLEEWGNGTVWDEIQIFLGNRQGRVLDLACGTGRTHDFLKENPTLDYYGCDISPMLIEKAVERGIDAKRLCVGDATKLNYTDNQFNYLFSIGSLEHFTLPGILATLRECKRVCCGLGFHQIPVSRSGFDEGWVTPHQSYWLNSERWWRRHFSQVYGDKVWTVGSKWGAETMRGVWFITANEKFFATTRK